MEVRRQEKGTLMPSSLGFNPTSNKLDSSSNNIIISAFEERKKDDYNNNHQNLDRHPPLFHHNQMNQPLKSTKDPGPTPDPTPASDPVAPVATRSASESPPPPIRVVIYRECLKNHAASKGGVVVDGCGEFMPTGDEGTPEALRCGACDCHRNFHRKEINGDQQSAVPNFYYNNNNQRNTILSTQLATPTSQPLIHYHQQQQQNQNHRYPLSFGASSAPTIVMTFGGRGGGGGGGPAESSSEDLNMFHSNMQGYESMQPSSFSKKRIRTKFSQEQKEKMMEFAEKIEWRIQKQDEQQVQQFCSQVGVKRKVFKVWMHNNKQAIKKKHM